MALQKQIIPFSMNAGVETKSDPYQVQGKLAILENATFQTPKEIRKRNGFAGLPSSTFTGGTISKGAGTATFKDELLCMDGSTLYSYSPAAQQWTSKGPLVGLAITSNPIVRNTNLQTSQDSALHPSGLQVSAWVDSSGAVRYSVLDTNSGQAIVNNGFVESGATSPKCCCLGNYFVIFYYNSSLTQLRYMSIGVGTPTAISAFQAMATTINATNPLFDVTVSNSSAMVVWNNASGISGRSLNALLQAGTETSLGSDPATNAINVFADAAGNFWVAYCNATATKCMVWDSALGTNVLAAHTLETVVSRNITGSVTGTTATVFYEIAGANEYKNKVRANTLTIGGTLAPGGNYLVGRGIGLVSKSFVQNGTQYVVVGYGPSPTSATTASVQPCYFLINASGRVVGKIANQVAGGVTTQSILTEVNQVSPGVYQFAFLQKDFISTQSGNVFSNTGVMSGTLDFTAPFQSVELGSNLHITGGLLSVYDGSTVAEHGFLLAPEAVTCSTSGSGGSILAGLYEYQVVYKWTDAQGQDHFSTPSVGISQTTTGTTSSNTLTIPHLHLTGKANVQIVVYRTLVNQTTFFALPRPVTNVPANDTVTYVDTYADSAILGNQQLYTTGGVIENVSTPATQVLGTYQNRLLLVPSENPLTWWFSQQVIPGTPVQMNDSFVKNIEQRGGSITAMAQLNSNLILFKDELIFYVTGQGPSPNGQSDDLADAIMISTNSGCVNPASLVAGSIGLMYKSRKGIYILAGNLNDSYVGADVEGFNGSNVTSVELFSTSNQVRFTLDSGVALVYDYFVGQWSVFTNIEAVDSTTWQNQFTYIKANGQVLQETPGQFTDNGQLIKMRAVSAPISFSGLQGFARVYRMMILGKYMSPHSLLVQVAYDFNPVFTQQNYINATALINQSTYGSDSTYGSGSPYGGSDPTYQWRVDFSRQKCESIQISIEDIQPSSYGEGFSLSAITFEVGQKQGLNRLPATRTFG